MIFHSKTSFLYYFIFMYKIKVLYHSKSIGKQEKIKLDSYLLKIKQYLCIFIILQVHLGWEMHWGLPGHSPMGLRTAGRW